MEVNEQLGQSKVNLEMNFFVPCKITSNLSEVHYKMKLQNKIVAYLLPNLYFSNSSTMIRGEVGDSRQKIKKPLCYQRQTGWGEVQRGGVRDNHLLGAGGPRAEGTQLRWADGDDICWAEWPLIIFINLFFLILLFYF